MDALEKGAIANPDEKRMVGHYWLRAPELAPTPELRQRDRRRPLARSRRSPPTSTPARSSRRTAREFTQRARRSASAARRLGPEFVADALGPTRRDKMSVHFFDNTDPDGIDRVLARLGGSSPRRLCVVISKCGGTQETRNGMLEAAAAYKAAGLDFGKHAVAVTGAGCSSTSTAEPRSWLARFPMWDWVGGRTSELSRRRPAARGAAGHRHRRACSPAPPPGRGHAHARRPRKNPAALLALMWYHATGGKGKKDMVVLPYKDRLLLFCRYLQQLVMESLGKRLDLDGKRRPPGHRRLRQQGLDRPARLRAAAPRRRQQLLRHLHRGPGDRGGQRVARSRSSPASRAGDYLHGFLLGTRAGAVRERPPVDHHHRAPGRRPHRRRCSSRSSSAPSASTARWSTSTPTTSPASRRARRPPPGCWRCKRKFTERCRQRRRPRNRSRKGSMQPSQWRRSISCWSTCPPTDGARGHGGNTGTTDVCPMKHPNTQ